MKHDMKVLIKMIWKIKDLGAFSCTCTLVAGGGGRGADKGHLLKINKAALIKFSRPVASFPNTSCKKIQCTILYL